jgi:uncharacterized protein YraI
MRHLLLAGLIAIACTAQAAATGAQTPGRTLCTLDVRAGDSLRLRAGPGPAHREVARIPAGTCGITVDERSCVRRWCIISHQGRSGWANTHYLGIYATDSGAAATKAH